MEVNKQVELWEQRLRHVAFELNELAHQRRALEDEQKELRQKIQNANQRDLFDDEQSQ